MLHGRAPGAGGQGKHGPSDVALAAESLRVTYNRTAVAVDGVSLSVRHGEIAAILGPNGAGKTTTLRALSGFLPNEPASLVAGRVFLFGRLQNGRPPHRVARDGMLLVPERTKVFATLTVDENLTATPTRPGGQRSEMRELAFQLFPALSRLRERRAGFLSGGERQMLAIAKALIADPRVLLVDELSLGLAPVAVGRLMEVLQEIRRVRGISIVIVEQNANAALRVADRAYIMRGGRIALAGKSSELLGNPDVQKLYLGQGEVGEHQSYRSGARG